MYFQPRIIGAPWYRQPGSEDRTGDDALLRQRTAKQALGALLKSFNVPASTDRDDVTSYTRSLAEFDTKGNRPDAETLKLFRQAVADLNRQWQNYKAMPRVPKQGQ